MTTHATRRLLTETIIDELQVLPELLRKAETRFYEAERRLSEKRSLLAEAEAKADAFAAERTAYRRTAATAQAPIASALHAELLEAQEEADRWRAEVDYLRRRHDNYRVMAGLLTNA